MSRATLAMTDSLYQYYLANSLREHPILTELRQETSKMSAGKMQIAPEQGQFMAFLVQLFDARKTLDIGVFTGYSSLAVALSLPQDAKVIACDVNEEWTRVAQQYWQRAGQQNKIELRLGDARQTLQSLIQQGEAETFDFAFIDADKQNYDEYYELSLRLLRKNGVIAIDNVFQDGRVADESMRDDNTVAIRALNAKLHNDARVALSMLPMADGLTLVRKL